MNDLTIRRSQLITPFGPGSIVEQKGGSFCVTTSDIWDSKGGVEINESRLQKKLRKDYFRTPTPEDNFGNSKTFAKIVRFPRWHFCKDCRKMIYIKRPVQVLEHRDCGGLLVPMRFIMICERGHMSDVPWERWVHSGTPCKDYTLSFISEGKSGGLESLKIKCNTCNKKRSLKGILSKDSLKSAQARCSGGQPWDDETSFECDKSPLVVQKGASNVIFPLIIKAVDIPPYSQASFKNQKDLLVRGDQNYEYLRITAENMSIEELFNNKFFIENYARKIYEKYNITDEELKSILEVDIVKEDNFSDIEDGMSLKKEEYKTFIRRNIQFNHEDDLLFTNMYNEIKKYENETSEKKVKKIISLTNNIIENVVKIYKLRIVSVYKGFHRLRLPKLDIFEDDGLEPNTIDTDLSPVSADRGAGRTWLPAVENYGEGIFISLNESILQSFIINNNAIKERSEKVDVPPKFLILHTISHALIRQLAFECGYPAASLSERIYCDDGKSEQKMAGILIYTYGDSHGSLGGLARQAKPDRFFALIYNAINSISWCSNDPLCIESEVQGLMSSNLAACHSCVLLPETSCEIFNRFLDRGLLIGTEEPLIKGLFQELINL